jgi:hypothetical protein
MKAKPAPCACGVAKERFGSIDAALRFVRKMNRKFKLYPYRCRGGFWHLTKIDPSTFGRKRLMEPMTNAERKHILNRLADLGRQIANEADKDNRRTARRQAKEIEAAGQQQAEETNRLREEAEQAQAPADTLHAAAQMNLKESR